MKEPKNDALKLRRGAHGIYLPHSPGHSGKHGHEFLEFEYVRRLIIEPRRKLWIGPLVVKELKRIVESSKFTKEDDSSWPNKNIIGKQELEIRVGNDYISFQDPADQPSYRPPKIGSLADKDSEDPEGLRVFYYLV
ncbi:mago nashi domain-containing protein [Ephemerocybe angulata]|uniref:Mago nashi domain-containing protein n=1 Tax=Ephemerocybe angulata TaxID=980116 RepID=A0A8H6MD62_9AGAR|nr:mago nashi domain-containing protein [Tulosesus angulatus]